MKLHKIDFENIAEFAWGIHSNKLTPKDKKLIQAAVNFGYNNAVYDVEYALEKVVRKLR